MKRLALNYSTYPLVVGSADKYEFKDWDKCGSSIELKAFYMDENEIGETAEVIWHSTNGEVVMISAEGVARALRTGYAQIFAADADGNKACCDIAVIDNYNRTTVQEIRLSADSLLLSQGESFQLAAELFPKDYFDNGALNTKLIWSSDNEAVAPVDQNGVIRALKEGNVTITAKSADVGRRAECRIRIENTSGQAAEDVIDYTGLSSEGNAYLYNLHICKETVTADSVNILWNRRSLIDLEEAFHYEVKLKKKGTNGGYRQHRTAMLGITIDGLESSTDYEIHVLAVSEAGEELAAGAVSVRTAEKETVCLNVCEMPYRAVGDGVTLDTRAIQRAINECPVGGMVYLPAHKVFLTGALFLKSNMTLRVDGILLGSTYPEDYPKIISRWEGWRKDDIPAEEWVNSSPQYPYNTKVHASLVNLGVYEEGTPGVDEWPVNIRNVVICGSGMINANGFKLAYTEGPNHHQGNGGQPEPISPIENPNTRGSAIQMKNAQNVYVKDLMVAYAPGWTIHPIYSDRISFDNLKVVTMGTGSIAEKGRIRMLNGDGIDPDSSTNVNIFNCDFTTGDDAIAIKSGRNREGNELDKPCKHIRITDCYFHDCLHGIALGSEIAAGVSDLLAQNIRADEMMYHSFWIKTMKARGGVTHDIVVRDCEFDGMEHGINLEFGISGKQHGLSVNPALKPAEIRDVIFENISIKNARRTAINIRGLEEETIKNVTLRKVVDKGGCQKERISIEYGENIRDLL